MGQKDLLSSIKDGPLYPVLKEILKEALEFLSLVFREFERLFRVISLMKVPE